MYRCRRKPRIQEDEENRVPILSEVDLADSGSGLCLPNDATAFALEAYRAGRRPPAAVAGAARRLGGWDPR